MCKSPISPTSPWYYFSPEGAGSLALREWMGETICTQDLERVVDASANSGSDACLASFVARVSSGEIVPRKIHRGRPKGRMSKYFFVYDHAYQTRLSGIREKQARGELPKPLPSFLSPCQQAAEEVAHAYKLAGGASFLNQRSIRLRKMRVSAERSRAFFVKEKLRLV